MKVLFISNLYPDTREPYRGLDNACLLHHLAGGCEIRVVSPRPTLPLTKGSRTPMACRPEDAEFRPLYVKVPYVPKVGSRLNHHLFARGIGRPIAELGREFPFEVMLCSWLYPDGCAIARLAEEWRMPFILIAQGSDVHAYLKMPGRRKLITAAACQASCVITRSADLATQLKGAGVPSTLLHPIYNGVDGHVFHPSDRVAARRKLGLAQSGRIVLFVGNFYPVKDPLLLVKAHADVCRSLPGTEVLLVMVGGGPLEGKTRALADTLGSGSKVLLVGRKNAAEVARYMQAADVLCLSSRNEGVPNVILEAFACGLPVVSTNVGGISEVLCHEHLGRLAASGDSASLAAALKLTLEKPPDMEPIVRHAAQFSWERAADAYVGLLRAAIKSGPPSHG